MDKIEAIEHNERVIKNVMIALVENKLADPVRLITDKVYAIEQIKNYIQAANITREMLHMPELYLISIDETEWYKLKKLNGGYGLNSDDSELRYEIHWKKWK